MDKLEHYLDQVCRGISGPRSLRQHIRQELREHLQDAAAEHRSAGLSEEEALARALEDFGGPEQVGSELEATHGHRLMTLVVDRAMQWKEMTLKAKWLWTSWAYLAVAGVIVLEVLWLAFVIWFIVPKFLWLLQEGLIDPEMFDEAGISWMPAFLRSLMGAVRYSSIVVLLVAGVWGLFEWLVRSENKPFMRLSAMGTAAVGLMVVIFLTAVSLLLPLCPGTSDADRISRPFALEEIASIDRSVSALEQALANQDWDVMKEQANLAAEAIERLAQRRAALHSLSPRRPIGPVNHRRRERAAADVPVSELRAQLKAANACLQEAQVAIRQKDAELLKEAMQKFHESYEPIGKAATRPEQ